MSPSQPPDEPTVWVETRYLRQALLGVRDQVAHADRLCSRTAVTEIQVRFGGMFHMVKCPECFADDYNPPPTPTVKEQYKHGLTDWLRSLPLGEERVCPDEFFRTDKPWTNTVRQLSGQIGIVTINRMDSTGQKHVRKIEEK